jgi:hypothetical protein
MIDRDAFKQKMQARIAQGIHQCLNDISTYVETAWFQFRQLWQIDQDIFFTMYQSKSDDLPALEGDIGRYLIYPRMIKLHYFCLVTQSWRT